MLHNLRVTNSGDGVWATDLVKRVGKAVKSARRGRSAVWLSERTAELGYKVSSTVIAKLDSGHRGSVLSVAELLILAAALDVPPILLLYPGLPDEAVEVIPGETVTSWDAHKWATGIAASLARSTSPSDGSQLVQAVRARAELKREIYLRELDLLTYRGDDDRSRKMRGITEAFISEAGEEVARLDAVIRETGGVIRDA